jgi:hypothetical protein
MQIISAIFQGEVITAGFGKLAGKSSGLIIYTLQEILTFSRYSTQKLISRYSHDFSSFSGK